jgi:hypothetical protein
MTTETKRFSTALPSIDPDLKVDAERHHAVVDTQFTPALTVAVAWASALASLSAAVLAQAQLVTAAAAWQMLGSRVPRPLQMHFDHERPTAEGATAHEQDDRPTGPGPLVADAFDEVLELLVDVDIADSIQRG